MKLHDLKPAKGARQSRKRVGRGMGSGLGKTAARGEKGQKSRHGYSRARGFEGGQMPLHRRIPKRGFTNVHRRVTAEVNLSTLAKLKGVSPITPEALRELGLISRRAELLKVLAMGEAPRGLVIQAHGFSRAAAEKIEAAGGKAEVLPYPYRGPSTGRTARPSSGEPR
jgi:large subunit ribosomal protein L15